MNLIDRYVNEVGRHPPRKQKADILAELRSTLVDTLEDRVDGEPNEDDTVSLLEEFGPPKKVAASYHPQGQYLVGPTLFPLFRLVVGISLAATVGAQLLALGVALFIAGDTPNIPGHLLGMLNSLPAAFGMVVIVFAILQWFDVRPESEEKSFDPRSLPQVEPDEDVDRGGSIAGIVFGVIFLVLLVSFPQWIGYTISFGGEFFPNPVIVRYIPIISLALLISIGLDIVTLYQGRWNTATRLVQIASKLFGIAVLAVLLDGHNAWLAAHGATGFTSLMESISGLSADSSESFHLFAMQSFRLAFFVALVVNAIVTAGMIFRLTRANLKADALRVAVF